MNKLQKLANAVETKYAAAGAAVALLATQNAFAGQIAEAVTSSTTDIKTDLYAVGAVVIGFIAVAVAFGAAIRLFRKGG